MSSSDREASSSDGDAASSESSWFELPSDFEFSSGGSEESDLSDGESGDDDEDEPARVWTQENTDPDIPDFTGEAGVRIGVPPGERTPLRYSELFLTDDVFDMVISQTNLFAAQTMGAPRRSRSRIYSWRDVDGPELRVFLGLLFLMGVNQRPQVAMYWQRDNLVDASVFRKAMSRNCWQLILACLHFADNSLQPQGEDADPLYKVRPLLDQLKGRFQQVYVPGRRISVDEELMKWRERLAFKQYIPAKRARFGVKTFFLCDTNGYLWNFQVYCGKNTATYPEALVRKVGKSGAVVVELTRDLLNQGRIIYVDNWYTSVLLAEFLREKDTMICGTLRKNRKYIPDGIKNAKPQQGQYEFRRCGSTLVLKFHDKREVLMISTAHKAEMVTTGKRDRHGQEVQKPSVIHDYNRHMGGVDRNDELIGYYTCLRKTLKWYKKVAIHFLEEALLNAFIVYRQEHPQGHKLRLVDFRLAVIRELLGASGDQVQAEETDRLRGRHFPEKIPATDRKEKPTKRCIVCYRVDKRRKETSYRCATCPDHPSLCPAPCFKIYHTRHTI